MDPIKNLNNSLGNKAVGSEEVLYATTKDKYITKDIADKELARLGETRCENCRFWEADGSLPEYDNRPQYGRCRKSPPTLNGILSGWPHTSIFDWCGSFEAKPIVVPDPKPEDEATEPEAPNP